MGRGPAAYDGVLRAGERRVWSCEHAHFTSLKAAGCAAAELERRREAAKVVLELAHCFSCDIYFGPGGSPPPGRECRVCERPLDPVKVMVL